MKTIGAVIFIAFAQAAAWPQDAGPSETPGCNIREQFKADGWSIPGLSKTTTVLENSPWTTRGLQGVYVTILKSRVPDTSVTLVSCVADHPERVEVHETPLIVLEILRFSMHGRVFAYRVTLQFMGIGKKKARAHIGLEMMLTFYDEEGSGLFTIMQYPGSDLIPKLDVPGWVKALPN